MKKIIYSILAIAILVGLFYIQSEQNEQISLENLEQEANNNTLSRSDFLPVSNHQLVHHTTYSLSYNEQHEQADWTVHVLKASDIKNVDYKRPYFQIDEMVATGAASWRNYKNSGYDRGHLVPAGDRRASLAEYEETFLTSNITPQLHEFNSGIWNDLEQYVRRLAKNENEIYVVTGSILTDDLESIGNEKVSVPQQFYKIVYSRNSDDKMTAFLLTHQPTARSYNDYRVPVDSIEQLTGFDFFAQLPDPLEDQLELGKYPH